MKLLPLFLFWIFFCRSSSSSPTSQVLHDGHSLSVDTPNNSLISVPDGVFLAGFFPVGENAYSFAVWFNDDPEDNRATVWMANRDVPVNGKKSKLSLVNGNLILSDDGAAIVWSTNTISTSSSQLKLLDTGNLELRNSRNNVLLWQSFYFPTDTILPLQPFTKKTTVVSSRSSTNFSSGFYKLFFDSSNILSLLFESPEVSSIYWPDPALLNWEAGRSTYNNTRIAQLDLQGNFTSTDDLKFVSADFGTSHRRRLKLDYDGNVRLYSWELGTRKWEVSWQAFSDPCRQIHGSCGPNTICSNLASHGRNCSCIPGYKMKDQTDWSLGCVPEFDVSSRKSQDVIGFLKLRHVDFYGYDMAYRPSFTLSECKNLCASSCDCKGFQFKNINNNQWVCFAKSLLLNGHRSTNFRGDLYLKVPKANLSQLQDLPAQFYLLKCPNKPNIVPLHREYHVNNHNSSPLQFTLWFAIAVAILESFIFFVVWCFLLIRSRLDPVVRQGYHLGGFRKFSYAELRQATGGFREEIGRGASGIVYKGVLSDNRIAAIKLLVDAHQGEAEFIAELSTIGRLNHMNLTEIWGYCVKGKQKLLVFEYMVNGSLAKNLLEKTLHWKQRLEIAIGTAKGLAYLHEECLEWVLHCDVKPHNILLDSEYRPKVSDFGLSLLNKEAGSNSKVSKVRGTRGYMAPEWILNQPITSKVDVYSYGMVLLEIVTGRNISHGEDDRNEAETVTLVRWVRERMVEETTTKEEKLKKIVDPVVDGEYEIKEMGVLVSVGLQCVEENKDERPTMGQVVEMLLGSIDID